MRKSHRIFLSTVCITALLCGCGTAGGGASSKADEKAAGSADSSASVSNGKKGSYEVKRNAKGQIVMKAGHQTASDGVWQVGFEEFSKALSQVSGDKFDVQIYPSGQLGDQSELIQQLQLGTVEMCVSSCADLGNYAPICSLLDVPYLFKSKQQAWNAMDGEIGAQVAQEIRDKIGIDVMGYWSGGTRSVFSSKGPINTVEDLKGLKMRTQPNEVHVKSFESLGVIATPIAYTELYSALQQKVIDAAENDPSNFYQMKFYEACKYYSLTEHIQQVATGIALISPSFYDALSDEEKGWVDEACELAQAAQRKWVEDNAGEFIEKLKAEGVQVNEVNKESFIEALQPFYEDYVYPTYGKELVEKIRSIPA